MRAPTSKLHCTTSTTSTNSTTTLHYQHYFCYQMYLWQHACPKQHTTTPNMYFQCCYILQHQNNFYHYLAYHHYFCYQIYCWQPYQPTATPNTSSTVTAPLPTTQSTSTTFATRSTAGSMRAPKQRPSTHTPCDVQTKLTRKGNMLANCSYVERQYFISHSYLYEQEETLENYSFLQYLIMRQVPVHKNHLSI